MKIVHKDRQLDLVGWYTLIPKTGPTPVTLPIHTQILSYNESAVLLGFHPTDVINHSVGGKLPLTVYESNFEVDDPRAELDGDDKKMEDGDSALKLKFRELPYTVETGEAEMISMAFVAGGGGNATAVESKSKKPTQVADADPKGKRRVAAQAEHRKGPKREGTNTSTITAEPELLVLSREEDELISALTAKANAIKMLHSRIQLLTTYLERLPPSFQSGKPLPDGATKADGKHTIPSHSLLRSIQALVNRLELLVPSDIEAFQKEILHEENDVNLVSLINDVMQSVCDARIAGKRFTTVENAKYYGRRGGGGGGSGGDSLPGPLQFSLSARDMLS